MTFCAKPDQPELGLTIQRYNKDNNRDVYVMISKIPNRHFK